MRTGSGWVVVALVLTACGGRATPSGESGAGVAGAAGAGGLAGGAAGAGGSIAAGAAGSTSGTAGANAGGSARATAGGAGGASAHCEPSGGGAGGFRQPTCEDLVGLRVGNGQVTDDGGDGRVSPGETITVQFELSETVGDDFLFYPGLQFSSDNPLVSVTEDNWLYAILACTSVPMSATVSVDSSLAPGTEVRITGKVAMLNADCPDTHQADLLIRLE